jgi:hypothetical protein
MLAEWLKRVPPEQGASAQAGVVVRHGASAARPGRRTLCGEEGGLTSQTTNYHMS